MWKTPVHKVISMSISSELLSLLTWNLRHPGTSVLAKELALRRKLFRMIQGSRHYIPKFWCCCLLSVHMVRELFVEPKFVKRHLRTPYSSIPEPHVPQNSRCKVVVPLLLTCFLVMPCNIRTASFGTFVVKPNSVPKNFCRINEGQHRH